MGWLAGWLYRKSHVINQQVGAGTHYQKKVTVHFGAGVDLGEDVYLNGKCRADFGDIRFTEDDGSTLLDYWIEEKVDGNFAVFWVEISDDLSVGNVTIYIYYGNNAAATTSDGDATFLFYDHFPGVALDLSKWDVILGAPVVAGSYVKLTWDRIETDNNFPTNRAVRMKVDPVAEVANKENAWGWSDGAGAGRAMFSTFIAGRTMTFEVGWEIQAWAKDLTEQVYEVRRNAAANVIFVKAEVVQNTHAVEVPSGNLAPCLMTDEGTELWCDWVVVRKFVSPEPTHGAWGDEEAPVTIERFQEEGTDFRETKFGAEWA